MCACVSVFALEMKEASPSSTSLIVLLVCVYVQYAERGGRCHRFPRRQFQFREKNTPLLYFKLVNLSLNIELNEFYKT